MSYKEYREQIKKEIENMDRKSVGKLANPLAAIKQKCLDCSGGNVYETINCQCTNCAIYPFRFGRNPYGNELSEIELNKIRQRFKEYRAGDING